jgi:hypothetical protein
MVGGKRPEANAPYVTRNGTIRGAVTILKKVLNRAKEWTQGR